MTDLTLPSGQPSGPGPVSKALPLKELAVSESSYVDPQGFVFQHGGGLYRAIRSGGEVYYRSLFDKGRIAEWVRERRLVESEISDFTVPEGDSRLVIRHRTIPQMSYCVEWSPSMLKDAALTTLDLAIAVTEENSLLQDAYPWNILFDGPRPVFVDLTSIVPATSPLIWPAYQQFLNFFLYPLEMMQMHRGSLARALLLDHIHGVSRTEYLRSRSWDYPFRHPLKALSQGFLGFLDRTLNTSDRQKKGMIRRLESVSAHTVTPEFRRRFLSGLKKKVECIRFDAGSSHWKDYYRDRKEEAIEPDSPIATWPQKQRTVSELLDRLRPAGVMDVGCNTGWYSRLAALKGIETVAVDSDEVCVDLLYRRSVAENLRILPLIMNMSAPTPAFGHLSRQFPSALERLRRDTALGLAVMHHMHVTDRQSFDQIARLFHALGRRAILEYVDVQDEQVRGMEVGRTIDYTLDSVMTSFRKVFRSVTAFPSDSETRKILLCEA